MAVIAIGCSSPTETGDVDWNLWPPMTTRVISGALTFSGYLREVPGLPAVQRIVVVLANPDTTPATIELGANSFGARLYASADLSGSPLWDDRPSSGVFITLPLYTFQVQGMTSLPFETTAFLNIAELRRVLPAGTYHAALTWRARDDGPVSVVSVGSLVVTSAN